MRSSTWIGLLLFTGCTSAIVETGPGDDDQPPPPPPPSDLISVKVVDGTTPQPGVTVLFQDANDALLATVQTDASGLASFGADTANVTVIRPASGALPAEVFTYIGAKVNDQLVLGRMSSPTGTPTPVAIKVPTGVNNATVRTPCGTGQGTAPTVTVPLDGCPATNMFFYISDNGNQRYLLKSAPVAPTIDFSLEATSTQLNSTLYALNVPPGANATIEGRLVMNNVQLFSTGTRNAATQNNVNYPDIASDQLTLVTLSTTGSQQMIASRYHALSIDRIDATANMLPYVSAPVLDATGSLTWTQTGAGGIPDAVIATLAVTPTGGTPYTHVIAAPFTAPTLHVPVLPAPHTAFNPAPGDKTTATPAILKVTGGYDALRPSMFYGTASALDLTPMGKMLSVSYAGTKPLAF